MTQTKEQKENKETLEPNTPNLDSSTPDFSDTGNLKLNDLETPPPEQSVISQANAQEGMNTKAEEVLVENFGTDIISPNKTNNIPLGDSGMLGKRKSKYHNQYWKVFLLSFFVILVTGVSSIILRLYSRYLYFASQPVPDANYQTYVNTYKN